jgi:hypothetical protein
MVSESSDPSAIRSVAVSREDLVAAVETNQTTDREAVLRVTPPFSGRMRARLHVPVDDEEASPEAIHLDPEALLTGEAPAYPRPADTEDALRADPDTEYTVERHRERHEQAVDEWRSTLGEHRRDTVTLDGSEESVTVDLYVLG